MTEQTAKRAGYALTNQRDIRRAFWTEHPQASRRKVQMGAERVYVTDTRCAFVEWLDAMTRAGTIPASIADRVTL